MQAFSAAQRALLDARDDQIKMCIEIDDTTPLRYCTGADPIEISSDWYDPKPMIFDKVALTNPRSATTSVKLEDSDKTIRTQWYSTKLNASATVYWYLRGDGGTWTQVLSVAWAVKNGSFDRRGTFTVNLSAASGTRPRAGGAIGTRSEFPWAPEPGEAMRVGDLGGVTFRSGTSVPPPQPGGKQSPFDRDNIMGKPGGISAPISGDDPVTPPDPLGTGSSAS